MGQKNGISQKIVMPSGTEIVLETGKLATQAHGSVVLKTGDTMILATVVSAKEAKEGQSFFPLSVDYQEKFASAGRIPGNFFRREARLNDHEILVSRLIDRAIRPLFPDGYMNETQVIVNLISSEEDTMPDCYAALAVSTALAVSNINFDGPISEVRVAKIGEEYIVNPGKKALKNATLDIIVAATMENVMMVEGEAKECQEIELIEAIKTGHESIKVQIQAQLELAQQVGDKALIKRELEPKVENEELKAYVAEKCSAGILEVSRGALDKKARKEGFEQVKSAFADTMLAEKGEEFVEENAEEAGAYFDKLKKELIREMVLSEQIRLDGRKYDEVRPIWCEVSYLPATHGSAIFNRGETQSLTSMTLGTKLDQAMLDTAQSLEYNDFILHYNFPALSVGEIKPMRGPGRREVGHANLAARSLKGMLPDDNPYTIRLVSDILESNGSSSMATVCAGSLALMDGGIAIKNPVSGIAMGMISDGDRIAILSDILGDEDALGDMDFKVTGTANGICACQMDIKIDGLPYEMLEKALMQAKEGRLHILNEMGKTLAEAREDLKPHAPRMVEMVIDKNFIGAVIGPGGKIIQEMQEQTGTVITIEEIEGKGYISIASNDKEGIDKAVAKIKRITFEPKVGESYKSVVRTVMPYGVFVDFNGKSGLVHISEISHTRIDKVEDVLKEGDEIKVKIIGIDQRSGKIKLSRKALMPKPPKPARKEKPANNE